MSREEKIAILTKLQEETRHLPPQGSHEWQRDRIDFIGGSEMSALMGSNPWVSKKAVIASKCGLYSNFVGSIATRWGKIFEKAGLDVLQAIFSIDMIFEYGSLNGIHRKQRYSPDGVAVFKLILDGVAQILAILFELKCPFSKNPSGKIPPQYVPQINIGVLSLPVDIGMFVTNVFHKCSLDDLKYTTNFDRLFHINDHRSNLPVAAGAIIIYSTARQAPAMVDDDSDDEESPMRYARCASLASKRNFAPASIFNKLREYDFGQDTSNLINQMLFEYDEKHLSVRYIPPVIFNQQLVNDNFIRSQMDILDDKFKTRDEKESKLLCDALRETINAELKKPEVIGVLPWKLFQMEIHIVRPDMKYKSKLLEIIDEHTKIIESVCSAKTQDEKIMKFYTYFMNTRDIVDRSIEALGAAGDK